MSPLSNSMISPLVEKMAWDDLPLSPIARDKYRERQRGAGAGGPVFAQEVFLQARRPHGSGARASGLRPGPVRLAGT